MIEEILKTFAKFFALFFFFILAFAFGFYILLQNQVCNIKSNSGNLILSVIQVS